MRLRHALRAAAACAALFTASSVCAQQFSNASFEINRDRVRFGTIGSCAKSSAYLIPMTYLYITARTKLSAGGGLGNAGAKARVYIGGLTKQEVQGLAAAVQDDIVGQMRAAGYTVYTWDDVKADVADKARMETNARYGMPTHDARAFPGTDFFVAAPNDDQTLDYGMMGPHANFAKAAQRLNATLLLPEIYFTLPQLGASASKSETLTWKSSSAKISFDPAMHLAAANVYGATAKGGWCSILVPEHGVRVPASVAGSFEELGTSEDDYGDWGTKRGDFAFAVDNAAFDTGVRATGHSLGRLIVDSMSGRR